MPGVSRGVLDCLASTQETQTSQVLAVVCAPLRGILTGAAEARCPCVCGSEGPSLPLWLPDRGLCGHASPWPQLPCTEL